MKKLKLDVENVRVESFSLTAAPETRAGSVDAFEAGTNRSCYESCGVTCVTAECGSCAPTCAYTCDDPECA